MHRLIIFIFLFFSQLTLFAQRIDNVRFEQAGKMLTVYYDLTTSESVTVTLFISVNGGSTWEGPLLYITGAAGENQQPGVHKKITWDVLKEREKLVGNIRFEVRAIAGNKGVFTDSRDDKTYKYVKIGTQVWMAENLNYYTKSGSWVYDNKKTNAKIYGRLYNWKTAKEVCPNGWHLPSDNEWAMLTDYLGGLKLAGGKMKEKGTAHWNSPNTGANNNSGFTVVPAGYRYSDGTFYKIGRNGFFWSSTENGEDFAYIRILIYNDSEVDRGNGFKSYANSCRCLRD